MKAFTSAKHLKEIVAVQTPVVPRQVQKSAGVVPTPVQKSAAVSTPEQKSAIVPIPVQKSAAVSTPEQKSAIVSTPVKKPAAVVSTPLHKSAAVVSTPLHKSAAVAPTAVQKSAAVVSTPLHKSAAVVPTAVQKSAAVVSTPEQKLAAVVSTPVLKSAAVVPTPVQKLAAVPTPEQKSAVVPTPVQKSAVVPTLVKKSAAIPTPPNMATYRCTVSYVESPDSFYVSPLENQEVWEKILMDIQNPSTSLDLVEVGNICISEQGGLWSRCKIEQVSSNTGEVRVFFIDHGSRETKPVSSLMKLETHRNTPGLVRRVGLAGIQSLQGEVWSDESLETFKELVDIDGGSTFHVTPQTQDKDGYKVIMVDEEGMNMRDVLVELDQARFELEVIESEPRMDEIVSMDRSIVDGDQVIFLNCGDSLNKIYVIKKLDRDHLNGELTTLNLKLEFFPVNLDNIPVLGGYVACPSDNDRIFRGRIENIFTEEMLAEVFLIDEGLNKIISWKELIPIPDGLFSSEGYAQMVLLKDVPSREALQFSREISTLANQEIIYTVHISGDKVILSSQDFNLNTKISAIAYFESKIMDTVGNNFSDLDPGIYEVVLLSNASTSLFYVSTKELINRWIEKISRLTEESLKTESTSKGLKAEPGDLVLVSSGGTWCRALVKKCQDLNIIQVLLVDIGVEDEFSITEIRPLPASLQQERFTSIPCVLQGSENLEPWETENLDVFNRIGFNTELRVEILGKIGWRNIVRFVNL